MSQSAAEIPEHNLQRKAAIARGGVFDHAGSVTVTPITDFDLGRTIFDTLEGALPRFVIRTRVAKQMKWQSNTRSEVERAYQSSSVDGPPPEVSEDLRRFLVDECDFDVEHADGSFLDHLYFCYEYSFRHYPERSPLVMLLHSILGTGTNTFAMDASKIPALQALMNAFEWAHVEAFPSVLRLLYAMELRAELWANKTRLDQLRAVRFHRVIDDKPLEMNADEFWIQLNYQLIHLVDFLPVSNWTAHANDTAFIVFRDLYAFLEETARLEAVIDYTPAQAGRGIEGESQTLGAKLVDLLPVKLSERMAAKSVKRFSGRINHCIDYELLWGA